MAAEGAKALTWDTGNSHGPRGGIPDLEESITAHAAAGEATCLLIDLRNVSVLHGSPFSFARWAPASATHAQHAATKQVRTPTQSKEARELNWSEECEEWLGQLDLLVLKGVLLQGIGLLWATGTILDPTAAGDQVGLIRIRRTLGACHPCSIFAHLRAHLFVDAGRHF
jgi:hypothetical protein